MRRLSLCTALAAALLAAGCATPTNPPAFVPDKLSAEQRVAAFEQVASTIQQRYIDPQFNGTDWAAVQQRYRPELLAAPDDKAFWQGLNRMVGELKDAHTTVRSPLEIRATRAQRGHLGLFLVKLGEHWVLNGVAGNSQAALLGLRPGQRVLKVDGEPIASWWQKQSAAVRGSSTERSNFLLVNRQLNEMPVDGLLTLELQRPDGSASTVQLRQDPLQHPEVRNHRLASGLGYLRFNGFNPALKLELETALKRLAPSPGLVLDLRGNTGGALKLNNELLGWFIPPGRVGQVSTRDNQKLTALAGLMDVTPTLEVVAQAQLLKQPMAVLIDDNSASAAELMAAVLQDRGRARVFGSVSCGCLLATRAGDTLPGGGRLQFSEIDLRVGANGLRIEGRGVQPDQAITPDPAALLNGQDVVLQAALAWLQTAAAAPAQPAPTPATLPAPVAAPATTAQAKPL